MLHAHRTVLYAAAIIAAGTSMLVMAGDDPEPAVEIDTDELLRNWAEAMQVRPDIEIRFNRYIYDTVFQIEERSRGRIYFADQRHGVIKFNPVEVSPDEVSPRTGVNGDLYRLEKGESQTWYWDGDTQHILYHDLQQSDTISIRAPEERGRSGWWSFDFGRYPEEWLRGIVGVSADGFADRFAMELQEHSSGKYHLIALPQHEAELREFRRLEILIDKDTHCTTAIRILDPTMNKETVYVLQYTNVDPAHEWRPDVDQYPTAFNTESINQRAEGEPDLLEIESDLIDLVLWTLGIQDVIVRLLDY